MTCTRVNIGNAVGYMYFNETSGLHHVKFIKNRVIKGVAGDTNFLTEDGEQLNFSKYNTFKLTPNF